MALQLPLQFEFKPDYTFNSFFAAKNQEIVSHLQRSIDGGGESQIVIWGNQGEGKSHLLHACCQFARQQQQSAFYLPLAADDHASPKILEGLENVMLVCLDNIDRICGHDAWENALFNFYNRQRDNNHKLILASQMAPDALPIKLPDLKTRLSWGLTLKLQQLDDHEKVTVMIIKAKQQGLEISPQVGQFLLNHYARDLPSIWKILDKIDHATLAAKRKLTIPFVKQIMDEVNEY